MDRGAAAREAFEDTFFSPWALLLAAVVLLRPVLTAVEMLVRPERFGQGEPVELAVRVVASTGAFLGLTLPAILMMMAAQGAWSDADRPRAAFVGRAAALLAVVALAWLVPSLLLAASRVGAAALYPAVLAFGIHALAILPWVAIGCAIAARAEGRTGFLAAAAWAVLAVGVPATRFALLSLVFDGGGEARAWWAWTSALSPEGCAEALRGATFPQTDPLFAGMLGVPASPLPFVAALAAWTLLPALAIPAQRRQDVG